MNSPAANHSGTSRPGAKTMRIPRPGLTTRADIHDDSGALVSTYQEAATYPTTKISTTNFVKSDAPGSTGTTTTKAAAMPRRSRCAMRMTRVCDGPNASGGVTSASNNCECRCRPGRYSLWSSCLRFIPATLVVGLQGFPRRPRPAGEPHSARRGDHVPWLIVTRHYVV